MWLLSCNVLESQIEGIGWIVPHYYFSGDLFSISDCYPLLVDTVCYCPYIVIKKQILQGFASHLIVEHQVSLANSAWIPRVSTCFDANNYQDINQGFTVDFTKKLNKENVCYSPAEQMDGIFLICFRSISFNDISCFSSLCYCFKILSKLTDYHVVCQSFASMVHKMFPILKSTILSYGKLPGTST